MEILNWIEKWYISNCDGDWEHSYGVKINTIDNPGWEINIDLSETDFEKVEMPYSLNEKNDKDWYGISVKDGIYSAAGDPTKLRFLLEKFKEFIEGNDNATSR